MSSKRYWDCAIGPFPSDKLPEGADYPMRKAVRAAYKGLTGEDEEILQSGWGGANTPDDVIRTLKQQRDDLAALLTRVGNALMDALHSKHPDWHLIGEARDLLKRVEVAGAGDPEGGQVNEIEPGSLLDRLVHDPEGRRLLTKERLAMMKAMGELARALDKHHEKLWGNFPCLLCGLKPAEEGT